MKASLFLAYGVTVKCCCAAAGYGALLIDRIERDGHQHQSAMRRLLIVFSLWDVLGLHLPPACRNAGRPSDIALPAEPIC